MRGNDLRERLIGILKLIASFDDQVAYQRSVPIADVPAELVCLWFDNYHPDTDLQKRAFTAAVAEALAAFNCMYEHHVEDLPSTLSELHASEHWKRVSTTAQETLCLCCW
jgi:hypothetical protein